MISSNIMVHTCSFKHVVGHTYDAVGCILTDETNYYEDVSALQNLPCYLTRISSTELEGKQPNEGTHYLYVNGKPEMLQIDKSWRVVEGGTTYSIVAVETTIDNRHFEFILTKVENS